jgi:hypothetical protein
MTDGTRRAPSKSLIWMGSGALVGAAAAAATVLGLTGLFRAETPSEPAGPPAFVDVSGAGIDHVYDGEFQFFVGGGVAVLDCNADLFPDLYFAGGAGPGALYVNETGTSGGLDFDHVQADATDLTDVTGAYPIDVDSDGNTDLAVLRVGENVLLRGLGGCRFERANEIWGVDGGDEWTVAFSAKWETGESLPTMVFGNYLATEPGEGAQCAHHDLLRPDGDGYAEPTVLAPGWCTLSALFTDWSGDGGRDLRMTNDRHYYRDGEEQLWRVDAGQDPVLYSREEGWVLMQIWGMGIASHDLTGDGLPEVFLTSQGDNKLQTLAAGPDQPTYEDIALESGATAHRPFVGDTNRPSTAWHAEFDDVNNDGFMDLLVTKGNVDAMSEFASDDPNNLLMGGIGGTFTEGAAEAGILDSSRSRGGAVVDLDLDGLLDLVVVERREPAKIWRNTGDPSGSGDDAHWLAIRLEQAPPNSDGIGAWIEVKLGGSVIRREVTVGGGHAGGDLTFTHFGLGDAADAELRVIWPDGVTGPWETVVSDQLLVLDRQSGISAPISPLASLGQAP